MKNSIKIFGIIVLAAIIGFAVPVAAQTSRDMDRFLDELEKLVDDYIVAIGRLMAGDTSVMPQISTLQSRIQEMGIRYAGLSQADLTPAQRQRHEAISRKFQDSF